MEKKQMPGGPALFLLLLFLLPGDIVTSTAEPQYLVLVPFVIYTETPEKVCVQLSHLNESVTLSVELEYGTENRSLLRQVVSEKNLFQCTPFQLPRWEKSFGSPVILVTVEITGDTQKYLDRKRVLVKNQDSLVFVQTDKPIYKPKEKVHFRIVSLDDNFHPLTEKFPLVYIQDPKRNRLFQWQDVELRMGITQLEFPLSSEPAQGTYKVVVQKASGKTVEHRFDVDEYVLPKFEVVVKVPQTITILDNELEATVCGKYTYGKPVLGLVNISICREYFDRGSCYGEESKSVCEKFSGQADARGCFSQVVGLKVFQLKRDGFEMKIQVEGKITEEGTEIVQTGSASTRITSTISTVTFENMDTFHKPKLPYCGSVKLVDGSNAPITNATIELQLRADDFYYKTDEQGQAHFCIDTSNFTGDGIRATATYKSESSCYDRYWVVPRHQNAHFYAPVFYSQSRSYLKILKPRAITLSCSQTLGISVQYILNPTVVTNKEAVFYYVVLAKGRIVKSGAHTQKIQRRTGSFTLDLSMDITLAPLVQLLVYTVLANGDFVTDSAELPVEKCFSNKVTLRFSEPEGLPGSQADLHLAATGGSLCAIHAVDESVFLLKPEAELSAKTVYNLLPVHKLTGYYYENENLEDPDTNPCLPLKTIIVDGLRYQMDAYTSDEGHPYLILKDFGVKAFTNTKIYKPNICRGDQDHIPRIHPVSVNLRAPTLEAASALVRDRGTEAVEITIRTFFPENWIWKLQEISGPPGNVPTEVTVPVTIPDTITDWRAGAFCLSPATGFGLAQTTSFRAVMPFFVEPSLPYSVVRGEAFALKATVFNYLQHPLPISVSLAPSPHYEASPVEKEGSYCLKVDGRKTFSWNITPKSLGEVNFTITAEALSSNPICGNEVLDVPTKGRTDIVVRSLLVEPEGIEKEVVFNNLLCTAKDPHPITISLKLPEKVVEGSGRASFCVLGDILGSAIQNLHQLLRLPYGCGEQNMALLAPNIYILDYLNKTGQLTEEIESKATGYMLTGFQRQLNYKNPDGSYSTFAGYNQPGNVWLTAFTMKSFAMANKYIHIEERHVIDARIFLAMKQKENGCFLSTGTLLNNALKGGVDDEISLSAYITIALLETNLPVTNSVVRNALFCLETASLQKEIHVYSLSLMAYAFALAGKEDKLEKILHRLQEKAVKEADGSIHWQRPGKKEEPNNLPYYYPRAPSAEVEMTSYVLLAYLRKSLTPSQEDLSTAVNIVRWLKEQQNPTGGFASTQDTVVALQALSLYGALTYSRSKASAEVTLKSGGTNLKQFQVDSSNRLLLQCQDLPSVPGEYSVAVTGEGCIYAPATLKYNEQPHPEDAPFSLTVSTDSGSCAGPKGHKEFEITVNVSYTGKRLVSNMAIINVKMVSGYTPNKPSVKKLEDQFLVQRVDLDANHVVLYLETLNNVTRSYSFKVEQTFVVQDLKPAFVEVYDYYEKEDHAVAEYTAPCSTAKHLNA